MIYKKIPNVGKDELGYFAYMKMITDSFVFMQSDNIEVNMGKDGDVGYKNVIWDGENIEYDFGVDFQRYIKAPSKETIKKENAETALAYLRKHSLTFQQWKEKYK